MTVYEETLNNNDNNIDDLMIRLDNKDFNNDVIVMPEPEMIVFGLDDYLLPGFHPPPREGELWPEVVGGRLNDVTNALIYLTPGLLALCTIGNLLAVVVLRRLYPGVLSTAAYVLLALFLDTLVVWARCGCEWLRLVTSVNVRELAVTSSLVLCKIYPFLSNSVLQLSTWMMVAMATETAWVHQHPQRLMKVCRVSRARFIILAAILLVVAVNSPSFWAYSLYTSPSNYQGEDNGEGMDGGDGGTSKDRPTCANEVMDERLVFASAASIGAEISEDQLPQNFYPSLDYRKMLLMCTDLLLSDLLPYFVIFSCCVMLVTKRLRRKDQVRQIDNTWKACNVDSGLAHQLHTTFIFLSLAHTILLFPKLVFKTFLFVTDPQVTGLVPYPVEHKPSTVIAKVVCYLLHYLFLSCKALVLLASSNAFRGECVALLTCNSSCDGGNSNSLSNDDHVTTGLPLLQTNEALVVTENTVLPNNKGVNNKMVNNKGSSNKVGNNFKGANNYKGVGNCKSVNGNGNKTGKSKTGILVNANYSVGYSAPLASVATSCSLATANRLAGNLFPQPPPPVSYQYSTLNKIGKNNHVMMTSTLPLHHPLPVSTSPYLLSTPHPEIALAGSPKPEEVALSTTVMENGTPCIKIFSMTSV